MSHGITIKLNQAANQFQANEHTGFGIRGGVKYYDRKTKQDAWTNYSAVIFTKSPNQIQFYQNALIEGAVVEVSAHQQKIEVYEGKNGPQYTIDLLDARLGLIHSPQQPQNAAQYQQQAPQQQADQAPQQAPQNYQQQPAQAPQQYNQAPQQPQNFDDSPPF